jgi:hypothetical protein
MTMLQTSAHVKILPSIVRTNHRDDCRQGLARETSLALSQVARIGRGGTSPYHDKSRQKSYPCLPNEHRVVACQKCRLCRSVGLG